MYIYLASPFFNETEIKNIEYAESVFNERGLSYFSPMRHTVDDEPGTNKWAYKLFEMDRSEIDKADVVVALYYGNYGDTGTAWECGYAVANGKPVVLVHIDENESSNLMLHCSCTTNIYLKDLKDFDFKAMPKFEFEGKMF